MIKKSVSTEYDDSINKLNQMLRIEKSYDVIAKPMMIANKRSTLYLVDGFVKDDVMEKIMEFLMSVKQEELDKAKDAAAFSDKFVSYIEADVLKEYDKIVTAVLSGTVALIVDGYTEAIMIDARTYPARSVQEPDDEKVLRGSRDGFVETLVFNTALIRRRIRDPNLTMEIMQVGKKSKTDVVVCYMDDMVDKKVLSALTKRIKEITINSLSMSQESLAECLIKKQWYNPFPRLRYTERPDTATANVLEGKIIVIIDNSPSVMILPTAIFDFTQDANDFYFPPLVGTYFRLVRTVVFFLTLFLTPVWYLLIQNPQYIPSWLDFIKIKEMNAVPIIVQLFIIEFVIDALKLASLNIPSVLSNSFSVVGALILGEFAIKSGWFVPEVVLYMAFVAIANFTQSSHELSYAFKLSRMFILLFTGIFNIWGFIGSTLAVAVIVSMTKTVTGRCYLFPVIPFNGKALVALFIRKPISEEDT